MSDESKSDGPKRTSTEPTLVIDRDKLPPKSLRRLAELDLDPEHPETKELMLRAQEGNADRETMERCPRCIACKCCGGVGMVTPARAEAFQSEPPPEAA